METPLIMNKIDRNQAKLFRIRSEIDHLNREYFNHSKRSPERDNIVEWIRLKREAMEKIWNNKLDNRINY